MEINVCAEGCFMFLSIGEAAKIIGVAVSTLRRWELEQRFLPDFRTKGNHRRYSLDRIKAEIHQSHDNTEPRITVCYSRVSSHDQKLDLVRQSKRLTDYCEAHHLNYELIDDLGSGINYNKKGLKKLIAMICNKKVSSLILTHRDRLLRFGSPLLFRICEAFDTKVMILDDEQNQSFEQALVADVIEIMTVFTAKMYGRRSHKNKKKAELAIAC